MGITLNAVDITVSLKGHKWFQLIPKEFGFHFVQNSLRKVKPSTDLEM